MKRLIKLLFLAAVIWGLVSLPGLLRDKASLKEDMIRLHVVANSDEAGDQNAKLAVRDAVLALVEEAMNKAPSPREAAAYLTSHLQDIQATAERALEGLGLNQAVQVSLTREPFPTRDYHTFRLPAGVYNTLRVTLGNAEGHNWWCVLFPSLCIPASCQGFQETALAAGMSGGLANALSAEQEGYTLRFKLLELWGLVENALFS